MSTSSPIPPVPQLATSGARARVAAMVDAAGTGATDGLYVADLLDALSATVLALAFVPADDARAILGALWSADR